MITESNMTLTPAYGRDYKSAAAAKADFFAKKDFVGTNPFGSGNCSISDFAPGVQVRIRYKKLTQVCLATVPAK